MRGKLLNFFNEQYFKHFTSIIFMFTKNMYEKRIYIVMLNRVLLQIF